MIRRVSRKPSETLTPRELKCLGFIADGNKNKEIADLMRITENSVKRRTSIVFDKIGAANRVEAALWHVAHVEMSCRS